MRSSPPLKKRRTDRDMATKPEAADRPCAGSLADDAVFCLVPVLADSVTRVLPVQTALVARIVDRRQTSALVARLAADLPVPALAHLKRVRTALLDSAPALFLLIDLLENVFPTASPNDGRAEQREPTPVPLGRSLSELESVLADRGVTSPLPGGLCVELYSAPVTAARPVTRRQYDQAAALWPTVFHRDLRVEASLVPPAAGPAERRRVRGWMAAAAEAARSASGSAPRVGCVIVDPATDRLVAAAGDARGRHALQHAVMRAVDAVATAQGGGAWNRGASPSANLPEPSSAPSQQSSDQPPSPSANLPEPSSAPSQQSSDQPPSPSANLPEPSSAPSQQSSDQPPSPSANLPERTPNQPPMTTDSTSDATPSALPYLCTAYDAFITREPCVMCAMALLHSRIGRVFYAVSRPGGALGSACKLHVTEGLNHRFQVFAGLGTELCRGLEDGERTDCADGDGEAL